MLDSKLEPQPGEGSGDNNCSMPRNKIPHDEGSGVEVHLSHLQADDPGSGVALANADRERLDNHDDGSRDNNISMALNTMPPDGHLVQAGESGDPCHLKRPGDSKNHVRTTVIGGCNNSAPIRSSKNIASRCILQDTKAPQHTTCENGRFIFSTAQALSDTDDAAPRRTSRVAAKLCASRQYDYAYACPLSRLSRGYRLFTKV